MRPAGRRIPAAAYPMACGGDVGGGRAQHPALTRGRGRRRLIGRPPPVPLPAISRAVWAVLSATLPRLLGALPTDLLAIFLALFSPSANSRALAASRSLASSARSVRCALCSTAHLLVLAVLLVAALRARCTRACTASCPCGSLTVESWKRELASVWTWRQLATGTRREGLCGWSRPKFGEVGS